MNFMAVQKDKIELEGRIIETLPNTMFMVKLDSGNNILAHLSGKMRVRYIRLTNGDRVRVLISKYDLTRGIITYRLSKRKS